MNIANKWRRFLVCGCSHGNLADEKALASVLAFKAKWKPDFTAHLGDFIDLSAFRSGSKGTTDESKPIKPDFDSGINFLKDLRPQIVLCGNHEDRLWRLQHHHSAIVSELAGDMVAKIQMTCDRLKAKLIPYDYKAFYPLANFKLMHGTAFGENACRDHAEMYGNVIHAHTHRAGLARGRRDDNPVGICVGTLTCVANMDYAKTRRATLGWSQGLAFGYYNDKTAVAWLCEKTQNDSEWLFPI